MTKKTKKKPVRKQFLIGALILLLVGLNFIQMARPLVRNNTVNVNVQHATTALVETESLPELIKRVDASVVFVEVVGTYYGNEQHWSGSGVIVDSNGLILTAAHVVDGATSITIKLLDGRSFEAEGWFYKDNTDVGIIKIDTSHLPASSIGDSDKLEKGESVIAIGCPFGEYLSNTVTSGIVSVLERDIPFFGEKKILQIDAAINPGNSGGAVFNMDGEVVGITVGSIYGSDDTSFCIPSNVAKALLDIYRAEQRYAEVQ